MTDLISFLRTRVPDFSVDPMSAPPLFRNATSKNYFSETEPKDPMEIGLRICHKDSECDDLTSAEAFCINRRIFSHKSLIAPLDDIPLVQQHPEAG